MKFRKTPLKQRSTYTYYDAEGNAVVVLMPGADGVTELDIKMLHQADDREVYNNLKNSKPKLSDDEKHEIKKWEESTGQDWTEKNYNLSFDAVAEDNECREQSKLWHQVLNYQQESIGVDSNIEFLHEAVKQLTTDQQWLYHQVYILERPQVEIAEELGVTKAAITNRLNKIFNNMTLNLGGAFTKMVVGWRKLLARKRR